MTDVEVASRAAEAAVAVLLELRSGELSGRALGDAGDAAAQQAILEVLRAERPDDVVFSEEAAVADRERDAAGGGGDLGGEGGVVHLSRCSTTSSAASSGDKAVVSMRLYGATGSS